MNTQSTDKYFKTSDLALGATLCYLGYAIEAIEKISYSKSLFLINKDDKLDGLIKDFWAHKLQVEPVAFFNSLKEIKNRLYDN